MTQRTTERLICILESVNATAIDNADGEPGEYLATVCREAAARLRELSAVGNVSDPNGYGAHIMTAPRDHTGW